MSHLTSEEVERLAVLQANNNKLVAEAAEQKALEDKKAA